MRSATERPPARDAGSAVVESTLALAALAVLLASLLQLGLLLHVRNTLVDCVSEGARFGALADRQPADGAARARALITASLPDRYAGDVRSAVVARGGRPVVEVTATVPLPVLGLLAAGGSMTVRGHGAVEVLP